MNTFNHGLRALLCFTALFACAFSFLASAQEDGYKYCSIDDFPVYGTAAPDASKKYSRLPDSLKGQVREELWNLGLHSAGLSIRFRSNTSNMKAKWTSLNKFNMNHMTPVGIRGLDLYMMLPDSSWTFVGSARPSLSSRENTSAFIADMEPQMREYMLFLSLYDGVDSISIGVDSAAVVEKAAIDLPCRQKPVVMYGTSILQGGCANRPGMAHTNILQRELNREVYNLGFSGNARLDPEIARVMASIDAGVFVIDALPNLTAEMFTERIQPFYEIIRAAHPNTPILFVENPEFPSMRFNRDQRDKILEKNRLLRQWYESINDPNAYYFESAGILGGNVDATVDNAHLTDLGFTIFADALLPVLRSLLPE